MDFRKHINIGFLALALVLSLSSKGGSAQQGATYVKIAADACSGTKLKVELDGVSPLPPQARLRVTRESDERVVLDQLVLLSSDRRYYWSGVLAPLGKYKAQLFDFGKSPTPLGLAYVFNNNDILKEFIRGERGEIVHLTRGGDESSSTPQTEVKDLVIDRLPASTGKNRLHIVVINQQNNKADEYFGEPPPSQFWKTRTLLLGDYRVIVIEYQDNGTCTRVRRT
jgi:hypothetical protein